MNFRKGHKDKAIKRKKESGNVLLVMFAAVAVVGVIGGSANVLMRGPLKTMSEVNETTLAESKVMAAGKMILLDVENLNAGTGDCDGDRVIEPRPWRTAGGSPAPTGGGLIPHIIGSSKRDPWGTELGYCVWDHGSLINGGTTTPAQGDTNTGDECTDTNRLQGTNNRNYPAMAVISAGANGTFETTCRDWVNADLDLDGIIDVGGGENLLFDPGGDDIFVVYSYAEAVEELPTIWREDTPDIWQLNVDTDGIEVVASDDVEFTGDNVFAPTRIEMIGDLGLLLPDQTQLTDADCTGGGAEGEVRLNTSGASPILEVCESNSFEELQGDSSGSGSGSGTTTDPGEILGTSDGLIAYWRLDETSNATIADSIGTANGTWNDSDDSTITTESSNGAVNTSLFFSGIGDLGYIEIPTVAALDNLAALSGCIWVNVDADSGGASEPFLAKSGGATFGNEGWKIGMNVAGGNSVKFETNLNDAITTTSDFSLNDSFWNHICATWDGTDGTAGMALYINGRLADVTATTAGGTVDDSSFNVEIGRNDASSIHLDGYADDVRIYNRALTPAEVEEIYARTNYITQASVEQSGDLDDTIGSFGWTNVRASDVSGASAGIGLKVGNSVSSSDAAGAAIAGHRTADPGRANLAFKTGDGSSLNTGMVVSDGSLVMDTNPNLSPETNIQIGDHYAGSWNSAYETGLLATNGNDNLGYFGNRSADDASMQMLFTRMLKFQYSGGNASSVREYLRFESTPKVTAFGNISVTDESSDAGIRVREHSGTASDAAIVDFARKRGSDGAAQDGDAVGSILFQGHDGAFPTDSQTSIRGVINGTVASGDVPVDIVFGTNSAGTSSSNEGLRITSDGDVGVGVAAPAAKLHVDGRILADEGIKIGDDSNCSSASDAGTMRYDSGAVEMCDGSSWVSLSGSSGGDNSCPVIPFDFQNRDDLSASTIHETNRVRLGLFGGSCTLTVSSDGTVVVNKNGVDQAGNIVSVSDGDVIYLKITSSASNAEYISSYVTIGEHTDEVLFQTTGKIVFFTKEAYTGNLGGVEGADKICQISAELGDLKGSFIAWISDDNQNPDNRFRKHIQNYYMTNGTKISDDWADLTDGNIDFNIDINQYGTTAEDFPFKVIWSRTETDGTTDTSSSDDCLDWTSDSSSDDGRRGKKDRLDGNWTDENSFTSTCDSTAGLYCFEQ